MGCDYFIKLEGPVEIKWICYNCGQEFDPTNLAHRAAHMGCADEHEGEMKIPVMLDGQGFDGR
jgi:hypothetical protein